jgi:hypothetical protein
MKEALIRRLETGHLDGGEPVVQPAKSLRGRFFRLPGRIAQTYRYSD